jgi:hypothetical protein
MVERLGRQPGAIRSRLLKLGLISETDEGSPGASTNGSGPPDETTRPAIEADPISAPVPGWEAFRGRLTDEPDAP